MSDELPMNHQRALGYLIAGSINDALATFWEDNEPASCCVICCGPCAALAWYRDNDPETADAAIISITESHLSRYDWQDPISRNIDWSHLDVVWSRLCPNHDEEDK